MVIHCPKNIPAGSQPCYTGLELKLSLWKGQSNPEVLRCTKTRQLQSLPIFKVHGATTNTNPGQRANGN